MKSHSIPLNPIEPYEIPMSPHGSRPRLYNSLRHLKFLPRLEHDHGGVNLDALGMELNCTSLGPWKASTCAAVQQVYMYIYILYTGYGRSVYMICIHVVYQ